MSRRIIVSLLVASLMLVCAPIWAQEFLANETAAFQKFGQTHLDAQAFNGTTRVPGVDVSFTGTLPWGDFLTAGPATTNLFGKADFLLNSWQPHVYRVEASADFPNDDSTPVESKERVLTIYSPTVPQIALGADFCDTDSPWWKSELSLGFMYQFNGVILIPKKLTSGYLNLNAALVHEFQIVDNEEGCDPIVISAIDFKSANLYYNILKWQVGPLCFTGLASFKVGDKPAALYPFKAEIDLVKKGLTFTSKDCLVFKLTVFLPNGQFYCTPPLKLNPCDFSLSLKYDTGDD